MRWRCSGKAPAQSLTPIREVVIADTENTRHPTAQILCDMGYRVTIYDRVSIPLENAHLQIGS